MGKEVRLQSLFRECKTLMKFDTLYKVSMLYSLNVIRSSAA
jgi:hypothetical protein